MKTLVVVTKPTMYSWALEGPTSQTLSGVKFPAPGGPANPNQANWGQELHAAGNIKPQSQYQTPLQAVGKLNF